MGAVIAPAEEDEVNMGREGVEPVVVVGADGGRGGC